MPRPAFVGLQLRHAGQGPRRSVPLIRIAGGLVSRRVDAIDATASRRLLLRCVNAIDASGRECHRFIRAGRGHRQGHALGPLQHQVAPRYW